MSSQTNIVLLYDLDTQNLNTKVIASTGGFLSEFTPEALDDPTGLTFDTAGDLYVASTGSGASTDQNGNRVLEYTFTVNSSTVGVTRFTSQDLDLHPLTNPPAITLPNDAVLGPDGNLYVASTYNNEVLEYSGLTGQFLNVFVTTNSGGLLQPTGMVFDSTGTYLYVVSSGNDEILQYYASGALAGQFRMLVGSLAAQKIAATPQEVTLDSKGNLYVTASNNGVYEFIAASGKFVGAFIARPAGSFRTPRA